MLETHFYPRIRYLKGMGDDLLLTGIIFTTDLNRKGDSSPWNDNFRRVTCQNY